jgi:hypothetical protein
VAINSILFFGISGSNFGEIFFEAAKVKKLRGKIGIQSIKAKNL